MTDLETRLRELDLPEPPLGFDTDEVADRAARQARKRGAGIVVAVLAVAVAVVLSTVAGPEPVRPAATPATPPPVAEQSRVRLALSEAVVRALPGVHDLVLGRSAADSVGPDRMSVTAEFVDVTGRPGNFQLTVRGPRAAHQVVPADRLCTTAGSAPQCVRLPQPGGGVLVLSELVYQDQTGEPVREGSNGFLYRPDGSTVIVTGGPGYPLTQEQLTKVITDPAFVLP
ncbi:hypothetical protein Q5425_43570 [Amycolatopsis sp. A133]|uniref:hypothetical protein n=1 Tax=Amycolatopsis sp. A133 TaxID=3064472 RepID=UPI0027EB16E0|nr:hypothetical protein [Amycolatopsis sp. A133]MDQ7810648.1 hypothetical protein [Amycolatopsis sp. A133]